MARRLPADELMADIAASVRASTAALDGMIDVIKSTKLDPARASDWVEALAMGEDSIKRMIGLLFDRLIEQGPARR